ncbi:MAG: YdcF family protein [Desulfobacterota bacterium]|nr:YdcF family protein [Thermodesulfobacteriota bacterium]
MKKIFALTMVALVLAAGFAIFHVPLLTAYARFFSVAQADKGADALVVLSGGIETRLPYALDLYRQGYAPRILLTDPLVRNTKLRSIACDEHQQADAILRFCGSNAPLTICPSLKGGATSTFDEAYDVRAYCSAHQLRRIIIVTDRHHTRRAWYAFTKIFKGTGVQVDVMGAPNDIFTENNWWQTDRGIEAYIIEPVKFAVYLLSNKNVDFIKNY